MKSSGVIYWEAGFHANADGYYESGAGYKFKPVVKDGRWELWNPTVTVVVRRIVNPIPMYGKRMEFDPKRNLFQHLKSTETVNMP